MLRVVVSPKYSSQGKKTKTLPSSFVANGVEEVKATISASTSFSQLATANIRPSDQDNLPVYHYYYYFNSILLFIMKSSSSFSLLALLATLYIPTAVVSFVPTYRVLEQQQRPQEPSSRTATAAAARVLQQLHSMQRGRMLSMAQDDDDVSCRCDCFIYVDITSFMFALLTLDFLFFSHTDSLGGSLPNLP